MLKCLFFLPVFRQIGTVHRGNLVTSHTHAHTHAHTQAHTHFEQSARVSRLNKNHLLISISVDAKNLVTILAVAVEIKPKNNSITVYHSRIDVLITIIIIIHNPSPTIRTSPRECGRSRGCPCEGGGRVRWNGPNAPARLRHVTKPFRVFLHFHRMSKWLSTQEGLVHATADDWDY